MSGEDNMDRILAGALMEALVGGDANIEELARQLERAEQRSLQTQSGESVSGESVGVSGGVTESGGETAGGETASGGATGMSSRAGGGSGTETGQTAARRERRNAVDQGVRGSELGADMGVVAANMREPNLATLQRIIRNGKYYYPATSHYPNATEVYCDRCNRGKLRAVIGWDGMDLCLSCAARIEMTIFYNGSSM